MLLTEEELKERMESPLNLLNRLRQETSPHGSSKIVSLPPTASEVIENLEDKIKHGTAKSKAVALLISAMDELKERLPEVQKPEKLAAIAASMAKVVDSGSIKIEDNRKQAQIIIYSPRFSKETDYEVVNSTEE
jgi:hypothetical protein